MKKVFKEVSKLVEKYGTKKSYCNCNHYNGSKFINVDDEFMQCDKNSKNGSDPLSKRRYNDYNRNKNN